MLASERPVHRLSIPGFRWLVLAGLCVVAVLFLNYVNQTDWVPQIVDAARNQPFIGPERVAKAEDLFYTAQDKWNQLVYRFTHPPVIVPGAPTSSPSPQGTNGTQRKSGPTGPASLTPVIVSDLQPGEGEWTATDLSLGNQLHPSLWRTFYRPDVTRPYARADLVHMDLTQTRLTLVPGVYEPRPTDGKPGPGQIPPAVQGSGKLLAAWNGGFLTLHGAYGMMVDRRVILPPRDGLATLAVYADGRVRLGVWGRDLTMTTDLVSFRQNGPILVDHGTVNPNALLDWGKSVSGDVYIWRSGIGLTQDGALVYALGNGASAQTLGEVLKKAGALEAMQLDVNAWHVFFFSYEWSAKGLVPTKLVPSLPGSGQTYLKPNERDFMYLTLK